MRIKITGLPEESQSQEQPVMAMGGPTYGGQDRGSNAMSLYTGGRRFDPYSPLSAQNPFQVNSTMNPVPREESTMEAERGETLVRQMPDGTSSQFEIGGKPHSQGGTPLEGRPGDFIFSQTRGLAFGGPVLSHFGKSEDTTQKFTPADIAKQYKINEYKSVLNDPNSDKLQKKTAQMNIDNAMEKLQDLATIQEAKKGFPQGVPQISASPKGSIEAKYGGKFQAGGSPFNYVSPELHPGNNPNWNQNPWTPQGDSFMSSSPNENWARSSGLPGIPSSPQSYDYHDLGFKDAVQPISTVGNAGRVNNSYPQSPEIDPTSPPYKNYGASRGDNMAKLASIYALGNTKQYSPYIAPIPAPQLINPTYTSPEREIAASQEQANSQSMINALSQDGARQRSIGSSIQGQTLSNIANTIGRSSNQNVDIVNRIAEKNSDTLNKYNFERAQRLTNLHGLSTELDSRYRDAIAQRLGMVARTDKTVEGNISHLNALNAINPNFEANAQGQISFRPGYHDLGSGTNSGFNEDAFLKSQIDKYKKAGASTDQAFTAAHRDLTLYRTSTTTKPMNYKATSIRNSGPSYLNTNQDQSIDPSWYGE